MRFGPVRACFALLALCAVTACHAQSPSRVLVVANQNNAQSAALANYYMAKRSIPASNLLQVNWTAADSADTCSLAQYNFNIAAPIVAKIATLPQIDYIVLCRNLPVTIADTTGSVDSALAGNSTSQRANPYFGASVPFLASTYNVRLVTRLDGWTWGASFGLVDRSLAAQGKPQASFMLDPDIHKDADPTYGPYNGLMRSAAATLLASGRYTILNRSPYFSASAAPLGGYFSWGSNDYDRNVYTWNAHTFAPGAIAEILVTTSASNLRTPGGTQSQIATLIQNGVTGVKGYVSEALLSATARPDILFRRYAAGRNLAEAFYAASPFMGWKDVVIGDPLCAPYAQ